MEKEDDKVLEAMEKLTERLAYDVKKGEITPEQATQVFALITMAGFKAVGIDVFKEK